MYGIQIIQIILLFIILELKADRAEQVFSGSCLIFKNYYMKKGMKK